MSFIEREREKLDTILTSLPNGQVYDAVYVYAAQQALAWASDPDGFASPCAALQKIHGLADELPAANRDITEGK